MFWSAIAQAAGKAAGSLSSSKGGAALSDLGLGSNLKEMTDDAVNALKKKKLEAASNTNPDAYGAGVVSPAVLSLFGSAFNGRR